MPRTVECPKCGVDISETYQPAEPDVGIMSSGWYCDICRLVVDEGEPEIHDDDVQLFGSKIGFAPDTGLCQRCRAPLEPGYGLAGGGGIGPYMYCPECGSVSHKSQDPEMK